MDGGCLLLVIGGSDIDQGGVGDLGSPPLGRAWSEEHFHVHHVCIGGFLGLWMVASCS